MQEETLGEPERPWWQQAIINAFTGWLVSDTGAAVMGALGWQRSHTIKGPHSCLIPAYTRAGPTTRASGPAHGLRPPLAATCLRCRSGGWLA